LAIFLTSVTSTEHPLPVEIARTLANLGLFVINQTLAMLQEPKRAQLAASSTSTASWQPACWAASSEIASKS